MGSLELRALAAGVVAAAPCSLEMPAGTGKTELLAASAATAAESGDRSLVLTHTNAGVEAIRMRLKKFGVASSLVRVETITSWAFTLARSYSGIAGLDVPGVPDWTHSRAYVEGATLVASTAAVRRVHQVSFDYLFVDEYQDCTIDQHELVVAISEAIPRTVVLGDRLQAIFGFEAGRPLADWDEHVAPRFSPKCVPQEPQRWRDHNIALGQWLLDIRPSLVDGGTFDFASHSVNGLRWRPCDVRTAVPTVNSAAYGLSNTTESVVLLDKWAHDVAKHASRLGGSYSVMEDVGGRFMSERLDELPAQGDQLIASWLVGFAKGCFVGLAGLNAALLGRLEKGLTVSHLNRIGLAPVQAALDELVSSPTYDQLQVSAAAIRATPAIVLYRQEAWDDTFRAIGRSVDEGSSVQESLTLVRDRLRRGGRGDRRCIASRTLLVKGLEFDHVIIANVQNFTDPRQLYVALSRARKSVTVIGTSSRIQLRNE
jgi:AAA domain/UvrD-like helicase C-terminal domain